MEQPTQDASVHQALGCASRLNTKHETPNTRHETPPDSSFRAVTMTVLRLHGPCAGSAELLRLRFPEFASVELLPELVGGNEVHPVDGDGFDRFHLADHVHSPGNVLGSKE